MPTFPNFLQVSAALAIAPLPLGNLDGTGLKIEWDLERTRSSTPDQGVVTVYNLGPATRGAIHEAWKLATKVADYPLSLSIGWGGFVEQVLLGNAWKITPSLRVGEDVLTIFEVRDGNDQTRDGVTPAGSNLAKTTFRALLLVLVSGPQGLRIPIDPVSEALILARAAALPIQTFNNFTSQGELNDNIDFLIDTLGLEWKIHQGIFIVMEKGNAATAATVAVVLKAGSGLLSWELEDDGGLSLTALANTNVKPGGQIQVFDSFGVPVGSPAHRVEKVAFTGATDGQSLMSISARKSVVL